MFKELSEIMSPSNYKIILEVVEPETYSRMVKIAGRLEDSNVQVAYLSQRYGDGIFFAQTMLGFIHPNDLIYAYDPNLALQRMHERKGCKYDGEITADLKAIFEKWNSKDNQLFLFGGRAYKNGKLKTEPEQWMNEFFLHLDTYNALPNSIGALCQPLKPKMNGGDSLDPIRARNYSSIIKKLREPEGLVIRPNDMIVRGNNLEESIERIEFLLKNRKDKNGKVA